MNAWLVYSPAGLERNRWFADHLVAEAALRGVALKLKQVPEAGGGPPDFFRDLTSRPPDVAVMRVIRPELTERLENAGVRCVNNAVTAQVANDKWRTYVLARQLDLPRLETWRFAMPELPVCGFPCVVKSPDGHGGGEVAWVRDADELACFAAGCGKRKFIAQRMCSNPGCDVRVYARGGEAVAAVRRTSKRDFRSNFSLGGSVDVVAVTPEQREIVRRLHAALGFDFVGVDFILHDGRWVLNEIEDVAGCRMLYAATNLDGAAIIADILTTDSRTLNLQ